MQSAFTKETGGGRTVVVPGKRIEFEQGVYETSDADEIKFLDEHDNCGTVFIKVEKDVTSERAEFVETLEEREARIEAREQELGLDSKKVGKEDSSGETDKFSKLSGPELKDELRKLDLPVSGKVDELRARLREGVAEGGGSASY
ncbi:MAG: SAP domain-containing protein [Candidatus Peribacteraceae bacterium]|nr:SAP domain-containing protein [Candidatus Peribacteraceae bacterium]